MLGDLCQHPDGRRQGARSTFAQAVLAGEVEKAFEQRSSSSGTAFVDRAQL
jgi:hypothetical protein